MRKMKKMELSILHRNASIQVARIYVRIPVPRYINELRNGLRYTAGRVPSGVYV
ncbi:hypothetical protein X777_16061 [Ooceraea biroi]|uniref:Uncharacterized protein n=1 Tax=Ooceraea biroi TaxID=2015173 RepID=A0A026WXI9_OOCBI|nr:hypothetical protein X777_16061 [Ooceraea biroi]